MGIYFERPTESSRKPKAGQKIVKPQPNTYVPQSMRISFFTLLGKRPNIERIAQVLLLNSSQIWYGFKYHLVWKVYQETSGRRAHQTTDSTFNADEESEEGSVVGPMTPNTQANSGHQSFHGLEPDLLHSKHNFPPFTKSSPKKFLSYKFFLSSVGWKVFQHLTYINLFQKWSGQLLAILVSWIEYGIFVVVLFLRLGNVLVFPESFRGVLRAFGGYEI